MTRRTFAAALVALIIATIPAQVGGAGGSACVWYGEVVVNSNNSYKLNASYGQNAVKFVINSQCRLYLHYDGSGNVSVSSHSVALIGYRGQDSEARVEVQNLQGNIGARYVCDRTAAESGLDGDVWKCDIATQFRKQHVDQIDAG